MTGTVELAYDVHGPAGAGVGVEAAGEGAPTAILLGSLGASRDMWNPQVEALSESARIITVDLRGHGESPAPVGEYSMTDLADDVLASVSYTHLTLPTIYSV